MADPLSPAPIRTSRPRRRLRRLAAAAVVLAVLAYFAPAVVARAGLTSWLLARAAGDLRGSLHVGGARLGWLYQPELYDVELRDEKGRVVLAAPRVHVDRPLLKLALRPADVGTVTIDRPTIDLLAAGDETNLERVLAAYLEAEPTGPTRTAVTVEIHQGNITLADADVGRKWAAEVEAQVQVPADRKAAIKVTSRGVIVEDGRTSNVELTIAYRTGRGAPGLPPQAHVVATADALPAGAVATFARRFEPGLRLDGALAGRLAVTWDDQDPDAPALTLEGRVLGRKLSLVDPRLGDGRADLADLELACKLTWAGGRIVSERARLNCDLGEASLAGAIDLSGDPLGWLQAPGVAAACDIDLARLSHLLPKRLQGGSRVTAGRLVGEVRSVAEGDGVAWSGRVRTAGLRGEHQGQPVAWDNPVSVEFAGGRRPGAPPRVDRFRLISDAGKLEVTEAGAERLTVAGDLDLGLLAKKLGQFLDLGGARPSGTATGRVTLTRDRSGAFDVKGTAGVRDLDVALGGHALREPDVRLTLDAGGRVQGPAYRLDTAGVSLTAGGDQVRLDLLEPVVDLAYARGGYARVGLKGDVGRWLGRLAGVVELPAGWKAAGSVDATARVRLTPEGVDVDSAAATINEVRFSGAGLNVAEPQLTAKPGSVKLDRRSGKVEVRDASVSCPALTVQLATLTADLSGKGPSAAGRGRVQGDVAKLQRWLESSPLAEGSARGASGLLSGAKGSARGASGLLSGTLDGPFDVAIEAGRVRGGAELTVRALTVGDPANPTWAEPLLRLTAKGRFEPAGDLVVFDELKAEAAALGATASGRVARLGVGADLVLTGSLDYDLERWQPQLRRFLGKDALVTGRGRQPFRVEGPLANPQVLKGEAAFGWQAMQAHGCSVGAATLKARALGDSWVRFDRVETSFNQGRLRLEPFVKLDEPAPLLVFGPKTGVERARLTAAMSDGALGHAAPLLAGLRDPQGEVSVVIDGSKVPLTDPAKGDVWGKITIHSARATPGPVLTELARALRLPLNLNLSRELVVPFRLYQGRVYHQDLELPLGEVTVKTSGSVGLDGTLLIVAELPVPARWLGKNAPKTPPVIKLPIGGTLSSPRVDEKALQQITAQYLKDAAGEALKGEVEKGLKKLFQPK